MTLHSLAVSVGWSIPVVSRWLWPVSRTFLGVASMVVTRWIVFFLCSVPFSSFPLLCSLSLLFLHPLWQSSASATVVLQGRWRGWGRRGGAHLGHRVCCRGDGDSTVGIGFLVTRKRRGMTAYRDIFFTSNYMTLGKKMDLSKKGVHQGHRLSSLCKKNTIHQVTTMLATSINVLFPDHNHLLTTSTDDPTLWLLPECQEQW